MIDQNLEEIKLIYNNATAYLDKGNAKKAIIGFKKVLKEYPCKEAYCNIGSAYRLLGMDRLMWEAFNAGIKDNVPLLDPSSESHLHIMNNLGLAHYTEGRDDEAIKYYTKAIKLKPKFWEAWWNCSTATLRKASSGQLDLFPKGWEMYKARFLKKNPVVMKNKKEDLVYWDTKTPGESIVILVEQGIGDNIMFGRYLSLLPFKKIYVQCDISLEPIFSEYECVRDASECDATIAYPICSLGECFPDIPAGDWLHFDSTYKFPTSGLNVGIVWAGSSGHANNAYRSVDVRRFHNLAKYCNLYSLSPGFSGDKYVASLDIKSWADTAKYINGLDLVISVDTSVIHLVGSMGREGWLLQPSKETDFRWGVIPPKDVISTSSVWYDSIRVFNNPNSWETVFERVENELKKCIGQVG